MSVSGINSYASQAMFQWQNQQLKSPDRSQNSGSMSTLFGNNVPMSSQVASMVKLTKYAMDAMGVGSDARVTFSQITKFRDQLQAEFSKNIKDGIAASGLQDIEGLTFNLSKDGLLSAQSANENDRKAAQAWLDANPTLAKDLRQALTTAGIYAESDIGLKIGHSGKLTVLNSAADNVQAALNAKPALSNDLRAALENMNVDLSQGLDFKFDGDALQVAGEHPQAAEINQWLADHPELAQTLKGELEKQGSATTAAGLRLNKEGLLVSTVHNPELKDIQAALDSQTEKGKQIMQGLKGLGIADDVQFSLQVKPDGTLQVVGDHPDCAKVQQFFDSNPKLVKEFQQILTLSGIDDARRAMQIAPSDMRKRIQIESMSAWWAGSGNANPYFGNYANGSMSMLAGVNKSV